MKKTKFFYKIYIKLEDQEIIYDNNEERERISFYTPFVEQKQDIDKSSTLYSLKDLCNFFMLTLQILVFFQNLQSIQNMRCFVLICFRRKFTFAR